MVIGRQRACPRLSPGVLCFTLATVTSTALAQGTSPDAGAPPPSTTTTTSETSTSSQGGTTTTEQTATTTTAPARSETPAPSAPPPPPAATSEKEAKEKDEDGRKSDILWIQPFFGYSYINLVQFSQDNFFPEAERTEGNGFTAGLGIGFRIKIITLGARVSFARYDAFDVGTAVLDLGLRIPIMAFEPYLRLGIGYGWVGGADFESPGLSQTDVFGLAAEAGLGLDIYLTDWLSIGVGLDAALLNLTRQDVRMGCSTGTCDPGNFSLEESGDAAGFQLRAHGHLGLHF